MSPFSKSHRTFRRCLPLLLALCAGCAGLHSPRTALDVARQHDPAVQWNPQSLLEADLDQDGRADFALLGTRKDHVVVGIVHGPLAAGTPIWTLEFSVKGGGEDALCSPDAKITVEPLGDEAKTRRGGGQGVGLNLHDDKCDAFHIFWNPEKKKFEWWRL
ncbi:MAG TPA: hypothetical protein VGM86_34450 [Thermoanaerobaculia bacterium]